MEAVWKKTSWKHANTFLFFVLNMRDLGLNNSELSLSDISMSKQSCRHIRSDNRSFIFGSYGATIELNLT